MDRQKRIVSMFDDIAPSYDLINGVLTLGIDKLWRRSATKRVHSLLKEASYIVDVACGSGDMIAGWSKTYAQASIIGVDASSVMLERARIKLQRRSIAHTLKQGLAQRMDFLESSSADIISIAYGLRNVVEISEALSEFKRVLRDDGLLVILEFTNDSRDTACSKLATFYVERILPLVGGLISRNYQAYKYLPGSIKDFLSLEELKETLRAHGFSIEYAKSGLSSLCIARCAK